MKVTHNTKFLLQLVRQVFESEILVKEKEKWYKNFQRPYEERVNCSYSFYLKTRKNIRDEYKRARNWDRAIKILLFGLKNSENAHSS